MAASKHIPLFVFGFVALCFALHPLSPFYTGQLADPDDYMRLNQVTNWLQNHNWYDTTMPRMAPDAHTIIHWSRLVDLPIALTMLPFLHFMGMHSAAFLASFLVPPGLFALLLMLLPKIASQVTDEKEGQWSCVLLLFAPALLFNFTPGRVDHHAYQILIAGFGLYALPHILNEKTGWRYAIAAGFTFACGLWIGTEALPWLGLFIALLALLSAWNGSFALRNAAIFGSSLAVFTSIALTLATPRSEFSSRALSWFSSADVILTFLAAILLCISWLTSNFIKNRNVRVALVCAFGLAALGLFIRLVPEILQGPFADYANFNATTALDNISEAQPFKRALKIDFSIPASIPRSVFAFFHSLFLPLLALGVCLINLSDKRDRQQQIWLAYFVFLFAAILLTIFWQVRVGYFMQLFTLAPLTWLLQRLWQSRQNLKPPTRYTATIGAFLLLGPLPVLLLPAFANSTTLFRDVVLFPAARAESSCNLKQASEFLNQKYNGQNITIMTGMNEGPELLFRTPFSVIGGNYNVTSNPDILAFFNARDDKEAQTILRRWHADVVLTCRNIAPFLAGLERPHMGRNAFLHVGSDGKLRMTSSLQNPALIEKLVNNKAPPWLKEIVIPGSGDYLLFEFRN